jgi:hypothetical protein
MTTAMTVSPNGVISPAARIMEAVDCTDTYTVQ